MLKVLKSKLTWLFLIGVIIGVVGGVLLQASRRGEWPFSTGPKPAAVRPTSWSVAIDRPGLPNLHRVNENLYRGAQPTAEGMRELHAMGIRTVVNLRKLHSDKDELGRTPLARERIKVRTLKINEGQVERFLRIVTDRTKTPVFVHCLHGADRTGAMCAAYRIVVQGWSKAAAIEEMRNGGFKFHESFASVVHFVKSLDVKGLRMRLAGATSRGASQPAQRNGK